MRVAAIDLGSNSFHMLVVEVLGPSSFEIVVQDKMMIQLGKGALVTGRLDAKAMDTGLRCLDEFRRMALARRVERTLAVATSAIREAENGEEFLRRAREESGIAVRVISGREEARLIHLAVGRREDLGTEKALLVDIGGGSVELTIGDASQIYYSASAKLGFLRLQGRFASSDPLSKRDVRIISAFVRDSLRSPFAHIEKFLPRRVIGTSGSVTTLLRLAQQRRGQVEKSSVKSAQVSREEIRGILADLLKLPSIERAARFDLDPLRAEYLPTALLCLDAILGGSGATMLTVCPVALREGLIYDFLARTKPLPLAPRRDGDLRLRAVIDLAGRCDYPIDHSHQVARIAGQIFRQTKEMHGLDENEERLLEYASILHDIGYHIGYSKHHKHAYYLVMNCDLRGFSPEERAILAHLVRYHRRSTPRNSHASFAALSPWGRKVVKALAAILRIADGLDRSHFSEVEEIRCARSRKRFRFQVITGNTSPDVQVDLWAAQKHARYFEKLFGVEAVFSARKPARRKTGEPGSPQGRG